MAFSPVELARRTGEEVWFSDSPVQITLSLTDLVSSDGHRIHATLRGGVAVPGNDIDRRMLVEVLLRDRDILLPVDAVSYLTTHALAPTRDFMTEKTGSHMLSPAGRAELLAFLRAICERAAFACGIELVEPIELDVQSPTLSADLHRAADRARAESDATARARHLQHLAELSAILKQTPPELVLQTVNEADRAMALAALLAPNDKRATPLFAVAGEKIIRWNPADGTTPAVVAMDDLDIGAFRSIQSIQIDSHPNLAIGGQNGVALLDLAFENPISFTDSESASRLGFNAVAVLASSDEIWATHSERGIVCWQRSKNAAPLRIHSIDDNPQPGARNLVALAGDRLAFSAQNRVFVCSEVGIEEIYAGAADVVALVPDDRLLNVIHEDGQWTALERRTWRKVSQQATGGPVSAATGLPWPGGVRLLLARRDGAVDCLGTQDTLVTRYASRHLGLRSLTATQGWIAGATTDRQRIILWRAADGQAAADEIHAASLTGHRVADICFGP
jgi:hypothetical protein